MKIVITLSSPIPFPLYDHNVYKPTHINAMNMF